MDFMVERTMDIEYQGLKLEIAVDFREDREESIVFIHGLGCSKDSFRDVWNFPNFERFSILAFDLIGFGSSSKPIGFSYSLENHAEVCKLVIGELNLDKIHLVGHSMGGSIVLLLIGKIPEKVVSFINLEGNLIGEDCGVSRRAVSVPYEEFEKSLFDQIKQEIKEAKGGSSKLYKWVCKSAPYAFYYSSKSLVEWSDSRKLLDSFLKLKINKVYVYGDKNSRMPVLRLIKDKVRTIPISNSGHFMMLDNPREFYQKLAEILSDGIS